MERSESRTVMGYVGLLLIAFAFYLGFAGMPFAGWLVLSVGALLVTYSLYTGSKPFVGL